MMKITRWMDRKFYADFTDCWDDKLLRARVLNLIAGDSRLLDLGAGRGGKSDMDFRGKCRFVAGVDPDEAVTSNPFLDEAKVMVPPHYRIPYPDESFDVVVSNSVLEHVTDMNGFFGEVSRVLKPGGLFVGKTPNRNHYVATAARFTPHRFHRFYNERRGREGRDTFPTVYACNTKRAIVSSASAHGLQVSEVTIVEGRPEYLRMNPVSYAVGLIYERLVNRFRVLERFRCVIMFELAKPGAITGGGM